MKGKHLSRLIPLYDDFIAVRDTGKPVIAKIRRLNDTIVAEQNIVRVEGQSLLVAIMRDITEHETEKEKFHATAVANAGTNPRSRAENKCAWPMRSPIF